MSPLPHHRSAPFSFNSIEQSQINYDCGIARFFESEGSSLFVSHLSKENAKTHDLASVFHTALPLRGEATRKSVKATLRDVYQAVACIS